MTNKALILQKKASASFAYDDGLVIKFEKSKPRHLQFYCMTNTEDAESCDLRLFKAALPPQEKMQVDSANNDTNQNDQGNE